MSARGADVIVVGGGAIGLAAAWRLAQRGAAVTVVDPTPGGGASTVAAGMLAPVTEARPGDDDLLALAMASWGGWPVFAAEVEAASGRPIGYRADGTLVAALDADDRAALDELVARQRALGLEVTPLRGREARALEPGLAPGVRAGALAAGERSVDPEALHAALVVAAERAGVGLVASRVDRILTTGAAPGEDTPSGAGTEGSRGVGAGGSPGGEGMWVVGVALAGGDVVQAPSVVLAAGCWSATVEGLPDTARPPVRPVKGQIVTLRQPSGEPLLTRTVRGLVHGFSIYLVPRDDGRIVCGATVEERGYDTTVTAGGAYELLRDVLALVPGLDDAELVAVRAGLRPGSPDDLPMVGPSTVRGLVVATGHHRNGILLTPITAEAVAAAVAGQPVAPQVVACDPRRFAAAPTAARVSAS
ncbi:MAG TPA: FAD-dependent oxidoreductase [Acidimicrobiales bacterium]|nr:FAD-dependent oxidoreductase [Acidimicrobiales bacterium]